MVNYAAAHCALSVIAYANEQFGHAVQHANMPPLQSATLGHIIGSH